MRYAVVDFFLKFTLFVYLVFARSPLKASYHPSVDLKTFPETLVFK